MRVPQFLDQVREVIRTKRLSYSSEKAYIAWIDRFIHFHQERHPMQMGGKEIKAFLTDLSVEKKIALTTQNQALNALSFLYKEVLKIPVRDFEFKHAKIGKRLPIVFSRAEVHTVLSNLQGESYLMASLLYGSGLRLRECSLLRVKDIDFIQQEIIIWNDESKEERRTLLPRLLIPALVRQIEKTKLKLEENLLIKEFVGVSVSEEEKKRILMLLKN